MTILTYIKNNYNLSRLKARHIQIESQNQLYFVTQLNALKSSSHLNRVTKITDMQFNFKTQSQRPFNLHRIYCIFLNTSRCSLNSNLEMYIFVMPSQCSLNLHRKIYIFVMQKHSSLNVLCGMYFLLTSVNVHIIYIQTSLA